MKLEGHKVLRLALAAVAMSVAAAGAQAALIGERSLIWSLQYEQTLVALRAQSLTTTAASFERSFDSAVGQDLRGRASLATGEVGTRVDSVGGHSGQAMVVMFDTLSFALPGTDPVTVSYTAHYEGELFKRDLFSHAYAVHQVTIYDITGIGSWIESGSLAGLFDTYAPVAQARPVADTRFDDLVALGDVQQIDLSEEGSFQILPGHSYGIRIVSNSFASGGSRSDFYGTGTFRFTDLGGASFESGSGVFLSAVGGTVDEPHPLALLVAAVAALAMWRVRRWAAPGGVKSPRLVVPMLALSLAASVSAQTAAPDDVERLLDWAEASYSQHFPGHAQTLRDGPYRYRHYPQTGNYVGVAGVEVYVLGPVGGGPLLKVGELGEFRCRVQPEQCAAAHPSRVFARSGSVLLESDGRVVKLAGSVPVAGSEPIAGSAASRLPISGRKVVMSDAGGYVLAADGTVTMWGAGVDPAGRGVLVARMVWPESLIDIGEVGGLAGLTADGSVLVATAFEMSGGEYRVKGTLRLPLDRPVRQVGPRSHVIYRDGTVARVTVPLPFGRVTVEPITGTSDVRSLACGSARCLALRTDGRVLAWGRGPLGDGSGRLHDSGNVAVLVQGLGSVRDVAVMTLSKTGATSVALRDDGQLWIWGQRDDTEVEVTYPERHESLDAVSDLACGSHCVVRRADGSIWGWGLNQQNELGNFGPVVTFQRQPVQAQGLTLP